MIWKSKRENASDMISDSLLVKRINIKSTKARRAWSTRFNTPLLYDHTSQCYSRTTVHLGTLEHGHDNSLKGHIILHLLVKSCVVESLSLLQTDVHLGACYLSLAFSIDLMSVTSGEAKDGPVRASTVLGNRNAHCVLDEPRSVA
jgi:hypothetical protein